MAAVYQPVGFVSINTNQYQLIFIHTFCEEQHKRRSWTFLRAVDTKNDYYKEKYKYIV